MNQERLMKVLLAPLVSEKSTRLADANRQFVFKVLPDSSKPEVRKAVELMFEVKVEGVQVINCKGKSKRFGRNLGRREGIKQCRLANIWQADDTAGNRHGFQSLVCSFFIAALMFPSTSSGNTAIASSILRSMADSTSQEPRLST